MQALQPKKLITAILPKGRALDVVDRLKREKNIITANFSFARGVGKLTPMKYRGVGEQSEKEVLSVIVDEQRCEEIFEFVYEVAEINRPHGGLIYMHALTQSTEFMLPAAIGDER